jgi:hypothetical protein
MDLKDMAGAIAQINSAWSIAAFAIAAILAALNRALASPDAQRRRGQRAPAILTNSFVWPIVGAICFLGALPILANTYLESLKIRGGEFYRVRVIVLDPQGKPSSGATLRTTVSNETTATSQDTAVITIPKALVPADGKVTVFADLDSAFLHGRTDAQLGADLNPSITVNLTAARDATVTGLVQDDAGRAVSGATVSVVGGESGETSATGSFLLKTNAAVGQIVRLHAEKRGYAAVDQDHPAGREPVTIVIRADRSGRRRPAR